MSVSGVEKQNAAFRPLIPGTKFIEFNNEIELIKITNKTAAVILETIQGGAGFITPNNNFLTKVKQRCKEVGALLILDEIQTGIGRTGTFWGFENYNVIPDIIITGKGLGGGMPIGAFISSLEYMKQLKENPKLGHISTFAGHPVISAAGVATINEIIKHNLMKESLRKGERVKIATPVTIADGAQTPMVGAITFEIIKALVDDIHTVTDEQLVQTMRFYAERMKMIVEPTGCLSLAAALQARDNLKGQRVGVIISGGNIDLARFAQLLAL